MSLIWLAVAEYGKTHSVEETDIVARRLLGLDKASVFEVDGGEGSGNFNHEGRPGQVGGSGGGGGRDYEEERKHAKSREQILDYVSKNPKVNRIAQARHVAGSPAFEAEREKRRKNGDARQGEIDPSELKMIGSAIRQKLKDGDFEAQEFKNGTTRLFVTVANKSATAYNDRDEAFKTDVFCVPVSLRDGIHFYPVRRRGSRPNGA